VRNARSGISAWPRRHASTVIAVTPSRLQSSSIPRCFSAISSPRITSGLTGMRFTPSLYRNNAFHTVGMARRITVGKSRAGAAKFGLPRLSRRDDDVPPMPPVLEGVPVLLLLVIEREDSLLSIDDAVHAR
jgi:hypothetical protein